MKVADIAKAIEEQVPLCLQESYDNAGLLVGHPDDEVHAALLCVDVTEEVMDEAEARGVDMVVSHHPIIFHGIKRLTGRTYIEKVVERAIRNGIALYACHTNLDSVAGGMSWRVGEMLGLQQMELLEATRPADPGVGFGVIGTLPEAVATREFLRQVQQRLQVQVVRHSDLHSDTVQRIALCTGAGASLIQTAHSAGADLYIAADFKYNDFLDARGLLTVADIGHFESEYCAIDLLFDIIRKKFATFALHKSQNARNPINYLVEE